MAERTSTGIEARLIDLGRSVDVDGDLDLVDAVLARLDPSRGVGTGEGADRVGARGGDGDGDGSSVAPLDGRRRLSRSPWTHPYRWAAAIAVFVAAATLAVAPAREAVASWLGFAGIEIDVDDDLPRAGRDRLDLSPALGRPVTLAEARSRTGFRIRVPTGLGEPDAYVDHPPRGVTLAWPEDGIVVTEHPGSVTTLVKQVSPNVEVREVQVEGQPGFWLTGPIHVVDEPGSDTRSSRRVANTLAWSVDGIVHRIELDGTLAEAQALVETLR